MVNYLEIMLLVLVSITSLATCIMLSMRLGGIKHSLYQVDVALHSQQKISSGLAAIIHDANLNHLKELQNQRKEIDQHNFLTLKTLQESLHTSMTELSKQLNDSMHKSSVTMGINFENLTKETETRLKEINTVVEKRLSEGFEKTTATFADVLKRLALIDEAQKKIAELSSNVISLQEVLVDKRSRGAFGEVQLSSLIRNVLPAGHFSFQHTLSNMKRVDCILFLPEPSGNIAIDSKFPLENYQKIINSDLASEVRKSAEQQFKQDIKKHLEDIASKYIITGETSDGAIMFIPAESIFAEIHANYPELVELSHQLRVWMVSPTTMMAILTTARAVLKDAATRKQIHIIQEHIGYLAKDFERFQKRMDNLEKHIDQAHDDVKDVNASAKKISNRFTKIEKVELDLMEPKIDLEEIDA